MNLLRYSLERVLMNLSSNQGWRPKLDFRLKLSENPHEQANLLTIRRLIAT
jgi:hypothetical protein